MSLFREEGKKKPFLIAKFACREGKERLGIRVFRPLMISSSMDYGSLVQWFSRILR